MTHKAQFTLGQAIKAISFTDCFGKFQAEITGLTVGEIRLIDRQSIAPYYRILALDSKGYPRVEGAERYFAAVMVTA